jgi:glycosyltransferase involved in cell wall biosynthesis
MSAGCLVIGSNTAPVRDVLNESNGLLVPFFDTERLATAVVGALAQPQRYRQIRTAARQTILDHYDLARHCLPALTEFVLGGRAPVALARAS